MRVDPRPAPTDRLATDRLTGDRSPDRRLTARPWTGPAWLAWPDLENRDTKKSANTYKKQQNQTLKNKHLNQANQNKK